MATSSLYGNSSESIGLYGIGTASGGTYFEWFIFYDSATAPATPTGGSWSFTTNTGTPPTGWLASPPPSPTNQVWVSLAIVDSRSTTALTWSTPGLMSSMGSTIANYITFVATSAPAYSSGRLWYDSTQNALSYYNDITNNTIHIGQETQLKVRNTTGATIAKGAPVYVLPTASGFGYPLVALAQADTATKANSIGLANQAIPNNTDGYICINGLLTGANTGTFAVGDVLYLSPYSAGQLMNTVPPTGYAVRIGVVAFSNTPNGTIYVNESNAFVLAGNVVGTLAITNGGTGATTASGARTSLGLGTIATQDANNVAITGGSIAGITDLAIADGGTGASTAANARTNLGAVGVTDTQTITNKTIDGASNTLTNIANSSLSNSSITINGSNVSLGGSATIASVTPNTLTFGGGLNASGSFNGSAAVSVALQTVGTSGTYGSTSSVPVFVTNTYGQVTSVTNTAISIPASQITGLGSMATQNANNVTITGGTIQASGSTFNTSSIINGSVTNSVITGGSISSLATALAIADGGTGAISASGARTNLGLGTIATYNAAVANGAATLDASGYLTNTQIPPSLVSGTSFRGTWNASTNSPTLTSSVGTQGYYYVVSTAGSTTLNGISSWAIGDWAIFNGSVWQKITQNTIISGGTINNTTIGATTPSTGNFTVLTENSSPVVVQTDIGTAANEIPLNQYLGALAYQDNVSLTTNDIAGVLPTVNGGTGLSAFTANGVVYASSTSALTTGTALVFDGTNFGVGVPSPAAKLDLSANAAIMGYFRSSGGSANDKRFTITSGGDRVVLDSAFNSTGATAAFSFTLGGTEGMRLTTTGLGIGTSAPATQFVVSNAGAQGVEITGSTGTIQVYNRSTSAYGTANIYANTFYVRTGASPAINLTVDVNGNVTLLKNISVGNATVTTSGTGITFPATQSASTDANTLDDYEEGTWTPAALFSTSNGDLSYAKQIGRYTKIGNLVTLTGWLNFTETTASGNLSVTGLPFTSVNITDLSAGGGLTGLNFSGLAGGCFWSIGANSTTMNVFQGRTGDVGAITNTNTGVGSGFYFSCSYQAA
jgi:hypothetical protein